MSERHSIFGLKGPKRAGRLQGGGVLLMIGKVSSHYGPEASGRSRSKKGCHADGLSGGNDRADFSPFAVELARFGAELKNVPDVRQDVVDRLQAQVAAGEYVPQLEQVARSLVLSGLLELQ